MDVERTRVVVVGAGPIGLEVAIELKRAGVEYLQVEKDTIASTILWFPQQMTFFSSTDRIAIAGVPIQTVGQRKCTKEEYLAYLRAVVKTFDLAIRTREEVVGLERRPGGGFRLTTRRPDGPRMLECEAVVLATGDMAEPRRLGIEGEDLGHVDHRFDEPHRYFGGRLLVIGGKNSAVEAALRCWHAGVDVALSYRRAAFDADAVKYWLLPELEGRLRRGEIAFHPETTPVSIAPDHVVLRRRDGTRVVVPADHVLVLIGFRAAMGLFRSAGVKLDGEREVPRHDPGTMETDVPGLYVAGTATAGSQQSYTVFIETCHIHARRIAAALTGAPPPAAEAPAGQPEN